MPVARARGTLPPSGIVAPSALLARPSHSASSKWLEMEGRRAWLNETAIGPRRELWRIDGERVSFLGEKPPGEP